MRPCNLNPKENCGFCPRLAAFREANRIQYPGWHHAPVPSFGPIEAELLMVGLAPGLKGANRTGRPFTGDYAGIVLYRALLENGFATGVYDARPDDGLTLLNCRITNAVRCVPPGNKPETSEIKTCNDFLKREIEAMPNLKVILCQGGISHNAVLRAFGLKPGYAKFGHAAEHRLPSGVTLVDSYHCSRLNVNTGRLTQAMFNTVVARAGALIAEPQSRTGTASR